MMLLISIFIPWLSFLLRGKILTAIVCFILQITILGWIPAAIWATYSLSQENTEKKLKNAERKWRYEQQSNNINKIE